MSKRKPTGFVAICQCGATTGAMDLTRTDNAATGRILRQWLDGGYTVEPRFDGNWSAQIQCCQCLPIEPQSRGLNDENLIDEMVNRFLCWKLPKDFAPDCGISFKPSKVNVVLDVWPTGTNLLHAGQAQEMFRHCLPVFSLAAQDVLTERRRQIEAEGWTPEHDDENTGFELARAGACYAEYGTWPAHSEIPPNSWPWPDAKWKPRGYRRNLIKACALLLAEIERIDRAEATKLQPPKSEG